VAFLNTFSAKGKSIFRLKRQKEYYKNFELDPFPG